MAELTLAAELPERGARLFRWTLRGLILLAAIAVLMSGLLLLGAYQKHQDYQAFQAEIARNYQRWEAADMSEYSVLYSYHSAYRNCQHALLTVKSEEDISIEASCGISAKAGAYGNPRWDALSMSALYQWLMDDSHYAGVKYIAIYEIEYNPDSGYIRRLVFGPDNDRDARMTIEYQNLRPAGRSL